MAPCFHAPETSGFSLSNPKPIQELRTPELSEFLHGNKEK